MSLESPNSHIPEPVMRMPESILRIINIASTAVAHNVLAPLAPILFRRHSQGFYTVLVAANKLAGFPNSYSKIGNP